MGHSLHAYNSLFKILDQFLLPQYPGGIKPFDMYTVSTVPTASSHTMAIDTPQPVNLDMATPTEEERYHLAGLKYHPVEQPSLSLWKNIDTPFENTSRVHNEAIADWNISGAIEVLSLPGFHIHRDSPTPSPVQTPVTVLPTFVLSEIVNAPYSSRFRFIRGWGDNAVPY
jgi:hypothetical protein